MLALAQALFVLQLMPQIGVVQNGVDSWRVQFWWKGDALTVPNRPTMEEAELDKARLEAAPDEDKPGIITAIEAEKKKQNKKQRRSRKQKKQRKKQNNFLRSSTSGATTKAIEWFLNIPSIQNGCLPAVVPPNRI